MPNPALTLRCVLLSAVLVSVSVSCGCMVDRGGGSCGGVWGCSVMPRWLQPASYLLHTYSVGRSCRTSRWVSR
ncbi:uncharacterized protein BDW47DRAFT_109835 [Aspergillus candidus]|uniref:Secreted protein n=1 Tax=Aspergillus candidus TaxID=41067 RepID=A0A2I2F584_ASPCN|nr:hypothetical protein BDW47DRAFT_109835 [Aspergillus candidus]PLB35791.1 hypothetical protein BDW47DRAFT_109835 [Aspergillus candidus]